MRVPSSRLVRLGSVARGYIAESGDTELQIPGVLQMSIELSSPIDKVLAAPVGSVGSPIQDSFVTSATVALTGAQIAATTVLATFDRGVWSLDISFSGGFAGTPNAAKAAQITIGDPDAATAILIDMPFIAGQFAWQGLYRFVFQRDGWQMSIQNSATIAGDSLRANASIHARKSL